MTDGLLTIGRFAKLSGLTEGALRHYDELGLLRPAEVDPTTGYRRYSTKQLPTAQTIAALRSLSMPLDEIAAIVKAPDEAAASRLLDRHRDRLEARSIRAARALHALAHATPEKETLVTTPVSTVPIDPQQHRAIGKALFNRTWELLETEDRTPEQDDELIATAHASRYHWLQGAPREPVRAARGDWLCSRVYATLRRAEPAMWHARRCHEILAELALGSPADGGREDFDLAGAYEGLARASAVAGDREGAERWAALGRAELERIVNPEDRGPIEQDLASLPLT